LESSSYFSYFVIHQNLLLVSPTLWILNPKFIILFLTSSMPLDLFIEVTPFITHLYSCRASITRRDLTILSPTFTPGLHRGFTNLVWISWILSLGFILKSSYSLVRFINLDFLTWPDNFQKYPNSKSYFVILYSSKLYMIKSIKECIHCLSIITMHFILFVIPFTYEFSNHLSIQIYHCGSSKSTLNKIPRFNINKLKKFAS